MAKARIKGMCIFTDCSAKECFCSQDSSHKRNVVRIKRNVCFTGSMAQHGFVHDTPSLPTNIVDFRGFDSSIILILRDGILMSIGDFPESLSQAMLAGCNVSREIGREQFRQM